MINGIDTPDSNGFVALTGLPAGSYYAGLRYQIGEVSTSLPVNTDQNGKAMANLKHANGLWIIGQFIGVGYVAVETKNVATGAEQWNVPNNPSRILDTLSCPAYKMKDGSDLGTVAGATAFFTKLAAPNTSGGGQGFIPGKK